MAHELSTKLTQMKRECDGKLEAAHREHADKLSSVTRDF
jgi:hypothetical protein